jgi:Tfp pilus assembly protein PilN
MVRINLIPKEIVEKRRYERYFRYVFIAGGIILVVLFGAWAFLTFMVNSRNDDLQARKEVAAQYNTQAAAFAIFEEKQSDLAARTAITEQALAGRINWAKISNEVSLVLPSEVWTVGLSASQDQGMQFTLVALDAADTPDTGHKAVAKTMVRLNDLDDLYNVWLTASQKSKLTLGTAVQPVINFQVTSSVVKPAAPASATASSSVPAPPPAGQ